MIRAVGIGLRETDDQIILDYAVSENCVLIARDKDFSNILIYPPSSHLGLIVLKIKPETTVNVHKVLRAALSDFTQTILFRRKLKYVATHFEKPH